VGERWRDIPGYEGQYQVSDQGRVRSLERYVRLVTLQAGETKRRVPPRILRPGPQKSGHLTVSLGRHNSKQVHALVLLAFVGPAPAGHEGLHRDHDPSNNRLSNLKWGTRSENILMDFSGGSRKHKRRITEAQVRLIRGRAARGFAYGEKYQLALEMGLNPGTIHHVISGRNNRTVGR